MDSAVKTWRVNYFQTARGSYPVKDFVEALDQTMRARVALAIKLLINQGPFLKPPYIKKLQDKLYELRISGTIEVRILYTIYKNEYYLLHVFIKKKQKTPPKEIKTAIDRMKELL